MSSNTVTPYDEVLYPGHALAQAHPDRLATIATLYGMSPAPISRCRVLELGCGDGTNVLSVALSLPEAQCVGVDLAAAGIKKGKALNEQLQLKNTTLLHRSLMDIGPEFGEFDYILAHGIYSWVPPEVQDKLLAICKQNLAPNGVAYVSYNAQPGGHFREMLRAIMRFHVGEMDPQQRVQQARALISFIVGSREPRDPYRDVLKDELERIQKYDDSVLFHDDLGEYNTPVYFHQFVDHAARHRLQYLGEAHFMEMNPGKFSPEVVETISDMADSLIAAEQYMDFVKCRRFRQTLLCHETQVLDRRVSPEKVRQCWVASPIRPDPEQSTDDGRKTKLLGPLGSAVTTDNPVAKSALLRLGEAWPQAVHFNDLVEHGRNTSERDADPGYEEDAALLRDLVLRFYAGGGIELYTQPPVLTHSVGERPMASPLARLQSIDNEIVTNLRHHQIPLPDPLVRALLQLLDGTRDRIALRDEMVRIVMAAKGPAGTAADRERIEAMIDNGLEANLQRLATEGLLVA